MNSAQTTLEGHENNFDTMEANTIKSLKTTKSKVKFILEKYECTRGDYRLLEYYYIRMFGHTVISFREFKDLRKNPSPETISRACRLLQNENPDLKPSERVQKKRARREEIIKEAVMGGEL